MLTKVDFLNKKSVGDSLNFELCKYIKNVKFLNLDNVEETIEIDYGVCLDEMFSFLVFHLHSQHLLNIYNN